MDSYSRPTPRPTSDELTRCDDANSNTSHQVNNNSSSGGGGKSLVLVDSNCRILKFALEKGMTNSTDNNNMGSNNHCGGYNNGNMKNGGGGTLFQQKFPYGQDELRRLVLQKYFPRSANPKPFSLRDETQVREAFADFVQNVPILVDGHRVSRKAWAKAFYESDIINSAKCLFEALFTEEEMRDCTLNGKNQTQELSAVKMLAILRASCWMKNKEQDPYLFNPAIPSHNVHPSKEEQDKIEKKVFTERRSQANRKNRKRQAPRFDRNNVLIEGDSDSQNNLLDLDRTSNTSDDRASSPGGSASSLSPHPVLPPLIPVARDAPIYEFGDLEELFYRFPDEFLDTLLPNWRSSFIFIDGLLVEHEKWKKAWEEAEPVKAAWILFLALFSDQEIKKCTLNGKNGTTELCPVKKLAIIRAVEWMRRNQGDASLVLHWDNDFDECNVFPSKEDKEKIETKVFTEKRYQHSRHLNMNKSSSSPSGPSSPYGPR